MGKEKRAVLLMHPLRRKIYQIISESPGSYFFEIASELDLPHGTVAWHLKKLAEAGLVSTMRFAGKRVFFSTALRNAEVEKAFVVLRNNVSQKIFEYILNNPDCYQSQIAQSLEYHHDTIRHHIVRLEEVGLITSYKKGRNVHYQIGKLGKEILASNTEIISRAYVEFLFEKLKEECLHPEVVEHNENQLTIRVSCPGKDDVYFSLELKSWKFLPSEEEEREETDDLPDLEPPKIKSLDGEISKPKIQKIDFEF
ncbi:MAG: winged helix-turn-helix transcriptional regulator [Methanobacteriota archaeon]|nr:MAG: winged helix-turn-helix transcriptional regulator [Euryarchaeota archaeon]